MKDPFIKHNTYIGYNKQYTFVKRKERNKK